MHQGCFNRTKVNVKDLYIFSNNYIWTKICSEKESTSVFMGDMKILLFLAIMHLHLAILTVLLRPA